MNYLLSTGVAYVVVESIVLSNDSFSANEYRLFCASTICFDCASLYEIIDCANSIIKVGGIGRQVEVNFCFLKELCVIAGNEAEEFGTAGGDVGGRVGLDVQCNSLYRKF